MSLVKFYQFLFYRQQVIVYLGPCASFFYQVDWKLKFNAWHYFETWLLLNFLIFPAFAELALP